VSGIVFPHDKFIREHRGAISTHLPYRSCSFIVMKSTRTAIQLLVSLLCIHYTASWSLNSRVSRRDAWVAALVGGATVVAPPSPAACAAAEDDVFTAYETRDRDYNKAAVIREDYWYMMGSTPPRQLRGPLKMDDPQWNAFGSCETSEGGAASNSCTYVSLKQRIPTYSKYAYNIALGATEYQLLKDALADAAKTNSEKAWATAASYVTTLPNNPPPPPVDALLKMVLFASGMLTSPNYSGPSRELLVARFYVNELNFALREIAAAIEARDAKRSLAAWNFGRDSWNSYFQILNGKIVSKVGDKFELIEQ
jgi:hypothetical protein